MGISTQTSAQQAAEKIRQDSAELLQHMARVTDQGYQAFWADPVAIAAALGADAPAIFAVHAALNQIRVQVCLHDGLPLNFPGVDPNPPYGPVIPPGWTYTINADGTLALVQIGS